MRNLGEIAHPQCKISIFSFNGKYIVKFEQGPCEQTFKFDSLEFDGGETFIRTHLTESFIQKVVSRFADQHQLQEEFLGASR